MKQCVDQRVWCDPKLRLDDHAVVVPGVVTDPHTPIGERLTQYLDDLPLLVRRIDPCVPISRQESDAYGSGILRHVVTCNRATVIEIRDCNSDRT